MADTVVIIAIHSGANLPASPSYVVWESSLRIINGTVTVLPSPGPIRLDSDGNATVSVPPGIWYVTEVVPGAAHQRRAVIVPDSPTAVQYADLVEVTNPAEIGFGPTWEQVTLNYALIAQQSAEDAASYFASVQQLIDTIETGGLVRSVNGITPDADGNIVITVSGTIVIDSISDASALGKDVLRAVDAAALRTLIGAGTGDGTSDGTAPAANIDWRQQAADGSYPPAGNAPSSQLLIWVGSTPPSTDGAYARTPSLWLKTS